MPVRKSSVGLRLAAVMTAVLAVVAAPASAQYTMTEVALSGQLAPGGTGGTFSNSIIFGVTLNASGRVAFIAELTGGTSTFGIFTNSTGSLQAAALQGQLAPGGSGGTYSNVSGNSMGISDTGHIAYMATLTDGSLYNGVFHGMPGSMQAAAIAGQAVPGMPGSVYTSNFFRVQINPSGTLAFTASLAGSAPSGVLLGTPGAMQPFLLPGDAAPSPPGGTLTQFAGYALNPSGQMLLRSSAAPLMFMAGASGALQNVYFVGEAAPVDVGGTFAATTTEFLRINAAGHVIIPANITGGTSTFGLFAGMPGALQTVAAQGQLAPGGSGSAYTDTFFPTINGTGVAFMAELTGGTATEGIFAGPLGSVQAVALTGQAAPGTGPGVTFSDLSPNLQSNASGDVSFLATLAGTGVTSANDRAIFTGSAGDLQLVVREGDMIMTSAGLRTVAVVGLGNSFPAGGQDGWQRYFNDAGQLAIALSFTDGTRGVFLFTPVPEPTTWLLLAAGAGAALTMVRRGRSTGWKMG